MVEERDGPYSWNRVSQRLNPAWMREWPESFLTPQALATGALAGSSPARPSAPSSRIHAGSGAEAVLHLRFENLEIAVRSRNADALRVAGLRFGARPGEAPGSVIDELEVLSSGGEHVVVQNGQRLGEAADEAQLGDLLKRLAVPLLVRARPRHAWLRGAALARAGRALVIAGDLGEGRDDLVVAMQSAGWEPLEDGAVAIRIEDRIVLPFGAGGRPEGAAGSSRRRPTPLASLVVATQQLSTRSTLAALSPALAVAELIPTSLDFAVDRDRAVERLCRLIEPLPVARLRFSTGEQALGLLSEWADSIAADRPR
jgi:hypothetical protein